MSIRYRREIDGLRALAVLPIVLFHAGIEAFSGGYVGVDIFFVISGFLITSIIRDQIERGAFSFRDFYERRARRILPALFFVLLVTVPVAWFWMLPRELDEFAASVLSVVAMVSNFYFWRDSGYFATASEFRPLLHTWSLAVEEQFYLLFPALLVAMARFSAKHLIGLLAVLGVASLLLAQQTTQTAPIFGFFMLLTRIWEFSFGAVAAVILGGRTAPLMVSHRLLRELVALAGIVLIAYAVFAFRKDLPYPGFWTVIPVLGTTLVILFATRETIAGRVLGLQPLVFVGLISYSVYLWHQPVFAFARIRSLDPLTATMSWALIAVSLVLGYLTWRIVEPVWRVDLAVRKRSFFIALATSAVLLVVFSLLVQRGGGLPQRFSQLPRDYFDRSWIALKMSGLNEQRCYTDNMVPCAMTDFPDPRGRVLLLGDSHSGDFGHPFTKYLEQRHENGYMFAVSGCAFLPLQMRSPSSQCARARDLVLEMADAHKFDTFILVGNYIDHTNAATPQVRADQINSFVVFVERLLKSGAKVDFFLPRLSLNREPKKAMALGIPERIRPLAFDPDNVAAWERAWQSLAQNPRFKLFSQDQALLSAGCGQRDCFNGHARDNYLLYRDVNHLTDRGATVVFDAFAAQAGAAQSGVDVRQR